MTRIAYNIAVSGTSLLYADFAWVSSQFARHLHPKAEILLFFDNESFNILKSRSHPILNLGFELVLINGISGDAHYRSRDCKTKLPMHLSTDPFIYLDCDAVPMQPLDALLQNGRTFAASPDLDPRETPGMLPTYFLESCPEYRNLELKAYYNSGVTAWGGGEQQVDLAKEWRKVWLYTCQRGYSRDQPSLNIAVTTLGVDQIALDPIWNGQFLHRPSLGAYSKVLHFFGSLQRLRRPQFLYTLADMAQTQEYLPTHLIQHFVRRQHAWSYAPPLDVALSTRKPGLIASSAAFSIRSKLRTVAKNPARSSKYALKILTGNAKRKRPPL